MTSMTSDQLDATRAAYQILYKARVEAVGRLPESVWALLYHATVRLDDDIRAYFRGE